MTRFLLVRHGENPLVGRALAGRAPGLDLSEAGRQQANRLATALESVSIHQIYSSPMARCLETAMALADRKHLTVETAEELNEVDFGAWTRCTLESLEGSDRWRRFNTFRSGTRPPEGENMLEVQS